MLAPEVEQRSRVGIAGEPNRPPMTARAAVVAAATSEPVATAATATSGRLAPQGDARPGAEGRAGETSTEGRAGPGLSPASPTPNKHGPWGPPLGDRESGVEGKRGKIGGG